MPKKRSIKLVIYSEYFKAALLPILIIELTLLFTYFAITGFLSNNSKKTLQAEATRNIAEIASREARIINLQIDNITQDGIILQKENSRLFTNPASFTLPSDIPSFPKAENGVHYKTADNGGSSLWYSALRIFTPTERQKAIRTEAMDPLFKLMLESNPNIVAIYFNSWDSLNRYYPYLTQVWEVFTPAMDIPQFNFYYLADAEHNPAREVVWTDTYLDPAGQGWMASCIAPIYNGDFLEGVTGIAVTIDRFVKNILALQLPWGGSAFLVDENGVIIAMSEKVETILGLKELRRQVYTEQVTSDTVKPDDFNLFRNKDPLVSSQIKTIFTGTELVNTFTKNGKTYFLTQSRIEKTGWRLMILADKTIVNESLDRLDVLSKRIGLLAFIVMILFYTAFFSFLMYKSRKTAERIAKPLRDLAEHTTQIMDNPGNEEFKIEESNIEEINLLNSNFMIMSKTLGTMYDELERKVKNRTTELESALANLQYAQQQIIQQEKMASIGQLAAGVAHEINNPMAFVSTNVNLLKDYVNKLTQYILHLEEEPAPDRALKETFRREHGIDFIQTEIGPMIEETMSGTERVKKIVNELKTFSRLTVDLEMTDINSGLESVVRILWNELKYKVEIHYDFGSLPMVQCNPGQINQVFMNIILNAAQAIKQKGSITIQTRLEGENVKIQISDTGSGMSAEVMNRIFESFYTTKEPGKGTGLGLSVSYEIIKKHKGTIEVTSEINKGTVFVITIPVTSPQDVSVPVFTDQ